MAVATDHPVRRVPLVNRLVMAFLRSGLRELAGHRLVVLRYTGRSGAQVVLPVQAAPTDGGVAVLAGQAATKQWWRHFRTDAPVDVLLGGTWYAGTGRVVTGADTPAAHAYRWDFPRVPIDRDATFVTVDLPAASTVRPALRGRELVRSWWLMVTVAEFLGFSVPALIGALTAGLPLAFVALLAAGAVEGTMLGWGQASVLRRALPAFPVRAWVAATAGAAVLAYAIGLLPSTFAPLWTTWPPPAAIAVGLVLGAALLASIGSAQALILRRYVARAGRWILATALAWLIGLGVFLGATTPLWQPGQALWLTVGIGVVGGLLMAATTSAVTGVALRRLLNR